jgi:hypothetical protein
MANRLSGVLVRQKPVFLRHMASLAFKGTPAFTL